MSERRDGGLWCREVLALLDRFIDGALQEHELSSVTLHVQNCEHCARFGGAYARVVGALRSTTVPSLVDDERVSGLAARVIAELP